MRGFECNVIEGTYSGKVTVWVDSDLIEQIGNEAIHNAAWREWRRTFGCSIGMATRSVRIAKEIYEGD